jgi:hypothetical protein
MGLNVEIVFCLLVLTVNLLQIILMIIGEVCMLLDELLYLGHYLKISCLYEILELFLSYLELFMLLELNLLKHTLLNVLYLLDN